MSDEMEQHGGVKSQPGETDLQLLAYVRERVNQLLALMGTTPMPSAEFAAETLFERDPLGAICESVAEVFEHLHSTNEQLTDAHEAVHTILAAADVGILVVDRGMQIQAYNPKFRDQLHGHAGELLGHSCCNVLCGLEAPPERCTFRKILDSKAPFLRRNWPHNNRFYDVSGAPVKDRHGEISRVVLVYQDVTDRRRTEDILIGSEEMYRQMFELSDDIVFHLGQDGDFIYANPACRATLGRAANEFDTLSIEEIVHPAHWEETLQRLKLVGEASVSMRMSTVFIGSGGKVVPVRGVISSNVADERHIITCGIFRPVQNGL